MDDWWSAPLRSVFGGRRIVLAAAHAAMWTEHIATLRAAGVDSILVVAPAWGTGPRPDALTVVSPMPTAGSFMAQIRQEERFVAEPPAEIVHAMDNFDPDRSAIVLGSFLNVQPELAGRPFLAHRRPEWLALEDKVVVDAFWDRAGIARQPSDVVSREDAPRAARRIDRGNGTVWAADAREGFHGGASQTYWVVDGASEADAVNALASVCDRVRVMPFIEGIPCSVHGIALPDGIAVLRPVEMVTLRRNRSFVYAGCATFWDPPHDVREQMRSIARTAGQRLVDEVGYRGTFTVDGVAAADGFWPTELNPRFGAGINVIARASGLPILLVNDLVASELDLGRSAAMIEEELLAVADTHRGGGTWISGLTHPTPPGRRDHELGEVTVGEHFVRCIWTPSSTPVGRSTAARACTFWADADRIFGTDLGPLTPAHDPHR
jgi:hypothetical protein